jgi:hypothetical protein
MWWSAQLRESWRRMWKPEAQRVEPHDVITVLNAAGVDFVLMGAHAMGGWFEEPRATKDVDVLIKKGHHRRAIKAIQAAFPGLEMRDSPVVTRFADPTLNQIVIDLMKPMHELHVAVFKQTIAVGETHRIPQLEMALACKFAAMVSPYRETRRKQQDAVDFATIVERNKERIDREELRRLGDLVYPDGGKEMLGYVDDAIAGRQLIL